MQQFFNFIKPIKSYFSNAVTTLSPSETVTVWGQRNPALQFFRSYGNYTAYYLANGQSSTPVIGADSTRWLANQGERVSGFVNKNAYANQVVLSEAANKWKNLITENNIKVVNWWKSNTFSNGSIGVIVVEIPPNSGMNHSDMPVYHAFINGTEQTAGDIFQDALIGAVNHTPQSVVVEQYLASFYKTLPTGSHFTISGDSLGGFVVKEIMEKQVKGGSINGLVVAKGFSFNAPSKYSFLQYGIPLAVLDTTGNPASHYSDQLLALFNDIRNPMPKERLESYVTVDDLVSNIGFDPSEDLTKIA